MAKKSKENDAPVSTGVTILGNKPKVIRKEIEVKILPVGQKNLVSVYVTENGKAYNVWMNINAPLKDFVVNFNKVKKAQAEQVLNYTKLEEKLKAILLKG